MNTLLYLRRMKLKNQLKSLFRKPSRLIYVLILIALLVLTLVGGSAADQEPGHVFRNVQELNAIVIALYFMMFVITVNDGFSRGGSLFSLSDVNLLFPAPLLPQSILFYGLIQQMSASLFIGIFLLFQYANLHRSYGISFGQLLFLLLGYALSVFLGKVTAMLAYSVTNGDDRKKGIGKAILYCLSGVFLIDLLVNALREGTSQILNRAVETANGAMFHCLPVAGWIGLATNGVLNENPVLILLGFLLCALYLALVVFLIFRMDPDYYEDVLKSAEVSQSAITAKKEGMMTEAAPAKVRIGRTGLGRGWGANTFYYKHLIENRRARKYLLSTSSLIYAATVILFSVFLRQAGLLPVFLMSVYLQMFSSMLGRFNLELTRPYLYLIPESPMKKMLWSLAESLPSAVLDGVAIFVPVGLILTLDPLTVLLCIVARLSFALLYASANMVVERIWGGVSSRGLAFLLFLLVAVGLAVPGVVATSVLSIVFHTGSPLVLLTAVSVCNLPVSLLALFLCRNMLQYAELNNQ